MLRLGLFLSAVLYANAFLANTNDECTQEAENYHTGSNSCYMVPLGELQTWNGAQTFCKGRGGDLASIPSQSAQDFVEALIEKLNPVAKDNALFININSVGSSAEGWMDGETSTYRHWAGGRDKGPWSTSRPTGCMLVRPDDSKYFWTGCYYNWPMEFICRFKK
ncbi:snaclec agkicetin-C subunit beta-like [Lineus longissimus]|uniref:snaclec agkicetin-C subunit beta-like n=1 Tax=Lineus longissimus TaxID=88925 RepID=UPI002B4D7330